MSYIDDPHIPQIPSAEACKAAGIDQTTLKGWISRKPPAILLTNEERSALELGGRFLFSLNRVVHIALVAELVRLKIGPRDATLIAAGFTDTGKGPLFPGDEHRNPGALFKTGQTLLIYDLSRDQFGRVIKADPKDSWHDVMCSQGRSSSVAAIIVNVNTVVERVRSALGLPFKPQDGSL